MRADYGSSLAWSPTVAVSWLWGLGFFYSIHVTVTYGWLGFLAFAIPNAFGLFLFGYVLGSARVDLEKVFESIQSGYAGLLVLCQLCAVGLTLFGFSAYLWTPLFLTGAPVSIALLLIVGCAIGHAVSLPAMKILHTVYLVIGVAAGLVALWQLLQAHPVAGLPLARFDSRFYGLMLPTLVGFLLGPWLDVQQWHRVVEMRRHGVSPRLAYAGGSFLFAASLIINACLAATAGMDGAITTFDGTVASQPVVAFAISRAHLSVAAIAFTIWAGISAVTTIDGFYLSTRWMLTSVLRRSNAPLLTFVPPALIGSPLWIALAAAVTTAVMVRLNLSMMYLMMPFATLFVSSGLCLVAEAMGVPRQYDATLCTLIGLAAALMFLVGYAAPLPAFLTLAPLVGAVGAAPMVLMLLGFQPPSTPSGPGRQTAPEVATLNASVTVLTREHGTSHGFDGSTFVLHMTPTYDDTNSVGNIYFANYVRWVGKTRELFFDICMPEFDLKTTSYYVLTRSFQHDFRREAREFEPITVRISIARHNRKFVTLAHEIYSDMQGLLGRGEQSLMFVDRDTSRPLDIPRAIIEGFLPYWPRTSPLAAKQVERTSLGQVTDDGA